MKTKNQALDFFKQYIADMDQAGLIVHCLRSMEENMTQKNLNNSSMIMASEKKEPFQTLQNKIGMLNVSGKFYLGQGVL